MHFLFVLAKQEQNRAQTNYELRTIFLSTGKISWQPKILAPICQILFIFVEKVLGFKKLNNIRNQVFVAVFEFFNKFSE